LRYKDTQQPIIASKLIGPNDPYSQYIIAANFSESVSMTAGAIVIEDLSGREPIFQYSQAVVSSRSISQTFSLQDSRKYRITWNPFEIKNFFGLTLSPDSWSGLNETRVTPGTQKPRLRAFAVSRSELYIDAPNQTFATLSFSENFCLEVSECEGKLVDCRCTDCVDTPQVLTQPECQGYGGKSLNCLFKAATGYLQTKNYTCTFNSPLIKSSAGLAFEEPVAFSFVAGKNLCVIKELNCQDTDAW